MVVCSAKTDLSRRRKTKQMQTASFILLATANEYLFHCGCAAMAHAIDIDTTPIDCCHFISNNYSFCCYCCIRVLNAPMPMSVSISPQVYNKRTNNSSLIVAAYFVIPSLSHSLSPSLASHIVYYSHDPFNSITSIVVVDAIDGTIKWHSIHTSHCCAFLKIYITAIARERFKYTRPPPLPSERERTIQFNNKPKKKSIEMWNGNACRWLTNCTRHQFVTLSQTISVTHHSYLYVSILRFAWPNKGMKKRKKKRQIEWRKVWILQFYFLFCGRTYLSLQWVLITHCSTTWQWRRQQRGRRQQKAITIYWTKILRCVDYVNALEIFSVGHQ